MKLQASKGDIGKFQKVVQEFYNKQGRKLPWRETNDPYKILVSEMMLQQTQVVRVIPKYEAFLTTFPTVQALADTSLPEVLTLWVGLGYNRRAKYLYEAARKIAGDLNGIFPKRGKELQTLPGVGPYTASAVATFAYNAREVLIETNIRTVFIHHFYKDKEGIDDKDILKLIERTLPKEAGKYREWYWALMDYGSHLKESLPNPSRKSKHHTVQSKFKGSLREARGLIVRILSAKSTTESQLQKIANEQGIKRKSLLEALKVLEKEGFITFYDRLGNNERRIQIKE